MRNFTSGITENSYDRNRSNRALPTPYRLTSPCSYIWLFKAGPTAFPKLYEGGLWLELINPGPRQAFQAGIYDEEGKVKEQRQFVISNGLNTFFWGFDNAHWPGGMYVLLLRDEFRQYEWELPL